jgi:hypothetical protein
MLVSGENVITLDWMLTCAIHVAQYVRLLYPQDLGVFLRRELDFTSRPVMHLDDVENETVRE